MEMPEFTVVGVNPKTNKNNTIHHIEALDDEQAIELAQRKKPLVPPFTTTKCRGEEASQAQINFAINLGIPLPKKPTKRMMSTLITYVYECDIDLSNAYGIEQDLTGEGWEKWPHSLHKSQEQLTRRIRAYSIAENKVSSISNKTQTALMHSSDDDLGCYVTSLENCTCPDFVKTGRPCKHMYYLATHFNYIQGINVLPQSEMRNTFNLNKSIEHKIKWAPNPSSSYSENEKGFFGKLISKTTYFAKAVFGKLQKFVRKLFPNMPLVFVNALVGIILALGLLVILRRRA